MRNGIAAVAVAMFLAGLASGGEWPWFRGPNHDGILAEADWLENRPENPAPDWTLRLGEAYSGFAYANGRIYTCGSSDEGQLAYSIEAETGRIVWRSVFAPPYNDRWGNGPRSTPAVAGGRVYVVGGEGTLACLDLRDGRAWKVGPDRHAPACVGHEYWLADGRRIAYHGFDEVPRPVLGIVDVHTGERSEAHQPVKTKHSHSLDGELIVGDGSETRPYILAWRFRDGNIEGPWPLCRHGGGWSEQRRHVHPRISPDGRSVVFTSDAAGHPEVYSVEMPDSLPAL